jgi:hypothetical protein
MEKRKESDRFCTRTFGRGASCDGSPAYLLVVFAVQLPVLGPALGARQHQLAAHATHVVRLKLIPWRPAVEASAYHFSAWPVGVRDRREHQTSSIMRFADVVQTKEYAAHNTEAMRKKKALKQITVLERKIARD